MVRPLRRAVEAFAGISIIQVMIGPGQEALYAKAVEGLELRPPAIGGATRQETVRRGLEALADAAPDFVLIHDAARPLVSRKLNWHQYQESRLVGYEADAAVVGYILQHSLGCTVVKKNIDEQTSWQGFPTGEVDAILENWGHEDLAAKYITTDKVAQDAKRIKKLLGK